MGCKHKDTKAQRHQEGRHQVFLMAAFLVSLCLGVIVFYLLSGSAKTYNAFPVAGG